MMTQSELCGPSRLRRAKETQFGTAPPPKKQMHWCNDARCISSPNFSTLTLARSAVHAACNLLHRACCDAVLTSSLS